MRLREAFTAQARSCAALGSPFMARLMTLCADRLTPETGPVARRLHAWPGDPSSRGESLPLRLAGGLHHLSRHDPALARLYPPHDPPDDQAWTLVAHALAEHTDFLLDWIESPPQTNEIGRAAIFRAAAHVVAARHDLPMDWHELGASAGLNLHWDAFALTGPDWHRGPADPAVTLTPDWKGPPPPDTAPQVATRAGVDLRPVTDPDRLLAYLWPDQPERRSRTEAALALPRPDVEADDAGDWLAARLAAPPKPGRTRVVAHSVAWQYFPAATQARALAALRDAGAAATRDTPLARIAMEADDTPRGAAITLSLWPGGETHALGRADFHGRWVDWTGQVCPH